jgi:glycosyltransferase involved in cell wall biosynthesis
MKDPLVSILIANYNNGKYISNALDSVLIQSYENWEIVLVDDASTDNSIEIISKFVIDDRIKLEINRENKGCGFTKNKCVELAKGKYCGFLDPDDTLEENALQEMIQAHSQYPSSSLIYSRLNLCDKDLNLIEKSNYAVQMKKPGGFLYSDPGRVSHFAVFKLESYKKTHGINPNLKRSVDQDLYLKLEEQGELTLLDRHLYNYRQHYGGISLHKNVDKAMAWNIKVRIDTCERRNISIEEVIPKIIQDSKSIHDFYQNSRDYRLGKLLLNPIRFIKSKFNI